MSNEDAEDRRARLEGLSMPGGPLGIDAPHATVMDRRHFLRVGGEWAPTTARRKLHTALLNEWRDSKTEVRRDRKATLFAGPPAAGKSTLMSDPALGLAEHRRIDADDFKRLLLRSAVEDGWLDTLLPDGLRPNISEQFHPLELSALVHHESTVLQKKALHASINDGENIALDGTLAHLPHAKTLLRDLGEYGGYKMHVIDVESSQQLSVTRVIGRWKRGYENAVASPTDPVAAMGGRWLPSSAVTRLFLSGDACSISEKNAREIAGLSTKVVKYDLYRASEQAGAPTHEDSWSRSSGEWVKL